jgi:hypothetical protein
MLKKYADRGFSMVAVETSNDHEGTAEFYEENDFDVPTAFDTTGVARQYGIMGTPTAYLIDGDGRIVWRKYGYAVGEEAELEKRVAELLAESS